MGAAVWVAVTGVVWTVVRSVVAAVVGTVVVSSWFSEAKHMHIIRMHILHTILQT